MGVSGTDYGHLGSQGYVLLHAKENLRVSTPNCPLFCHSSTWSHQVRPPARSDLVQHVTFIIYSWIYDDVWNPLSETLINYKLL